MHLFGHHFGPHFGHHFGCRFANVFPHFGPHLWPREIILRIILCTFWEPISRAIWAQFRPIFGPNFPHFGADFEAKMVDVSSGIGHQNGHQQQPRVRVIILVYVHQWPFRATGAPSVCNLPKGQIAHTAHAIDLKVNCMR